MSGLDALEWPRLSMRTSLVLLVRFGDMTTDQLLFALAGLANKVATKIAAKALPWTCRSQHDAYLHGYRDGLQDGWTRRDLKLPR